MPIRSINLKFQIPKTTEGQMVRSALWRTHNQLNQAVTTIENLFMICRQGQYHNINENTEEVVAQADQV